MRVAVYCDLRYQRRGGALYCDESFARFIAGLADLTERLVLIGRLDARGARPFAHRVRDDVELQALPDYAELSRGAPAALALLRSLPRVWRLLATVDSVWLLGPHPFAVACAFMAFARRRRVVLGVRENLLAYVELRHPRRWPRTVTRALDGTWRALARAAPVVVVGSELAARYRRAHEVVPIAVSLVGLDEPADASPVCAREYDGELTALAVGRLDPEKNPLLLADVLAGLRARDARWRLVVCGSGSLEPALRRRLDALGLQERATLTGVVGAAELRSRYASAHALLHVSWSEGVPQVLFEAWAAGLPVVATDVGGVGDAARGAALLIPPGDAGAAVRELERLAADAGLRHRLTEAGHERIGRHAAATECGKIAALLARGPTKRARSQPMHRHMWLWAVVAPETRRVAVAGDAGLAAVVRAAGFDVSDAGAGAPDAVLADAGGRFAAGAARRLAGDSGLIAVALGGGRATVPDQQSRPARLLELLLGPAQAAAAAARARTLARELERSGFDVATLATGERTRPYGLGPGVWRRHRRLPLGRIVVGARGGLPRSVADAAVAEAGAALGAPLRRTGMAVTESGKLMLELLDPSGRPYLVRVAGGPARPLLERCLDRLAELAAADPGPALRERVPWPLGDGEVGGARWVLERKAAGRAGARMTTRLWGECLDLLVELHALDRDPTAAEGRGAIAAQATAIGAHVDAARGAALARLAERLADQLAPAPLGWAHGDFWAENLLVRHGRVNVIVDWDHAARRSLPMLDLMDLIASSERRSRGLRPGPRLLRLLWPLARSGGDERMRRYCARTGTPSDGRTLEALALAYWLAHVARDLLPFADRRRPAWLEENVVAPLDELRRVGW